MVAAMTPDLGAALRDWFNARDVRRMDRTGSWPATLERLYWTAYEYQRDLERLQRRLYRPTLERASQPYPDLATYPAIAPRQIRARPHRQPLLYRVSYERISYATWAAAVPPANALR